MGGDALATVIDANKSRNRPGISEAPLQGLARRYGISCVTACHMRTPRVTGLSFDAPPCSNRGPDSTFVARQGPNMARRNQPNEVRAVATNGTRSKRAAAQFTEHVPVRFDPQLVKDVQVFADARMWSFNQAIRVLVRRGLTTTAEHVTLDYEPFEESP